MRRIRTLELKWIPLVEWTLTEINKSLTVRKWIWIIQLNYQMDKLMAKAIFLIVTVSKEFCKLVIKLILNNWDKKMTQITKEEWIIWIRKMLRPQKAVLILKIDFLAIVQTSIFKTTERLKWLWAQIAHLPQEIKTISNSTIVTKEDIQV